MIEIQSLRTADELQRFLSFAAEVYGGNPCWVPPDPHDLSLLDGSAPQGEHTRVQAFWALSDGKIKATLAAMVDESFNRHWNDRMGHLLFFEALRESEEAVQALFDAACQWLRAQDCRAARCAYLYGWQLPLTIDAYDAPPTFGHTYNPPYYHRYIKDAGFRTERGALEYQVRFTPELRRAYGNFIARSSQAGVRLRSWDFARLEAETAVFLDLYNETFASHWGAPRFTLNEMLGLTVGLQEFLVPEFTVFAGVDGETAGFVFSLPDIHQAALGRQIDHGVLLVIGVRERYRGRGINTAMAARSYLAMMDRGYRSASYTIVLDDNWPSRRTAEKLGARVARNFNVYRKDLAAG